MAQQNQFSSQDKKVYSIPINSLAAGTTAIGPALPATGGIGTGLINSAAAAYKVIGFMFISTAAATVQLTDSTLGVPLFGPLPPAATSALPSPPAGNPLHATPVRPMDANPDPGCAPKILISSR